MEKNKQFLLWILKNRGACTITEIEKLSYLIDLSAVKQFGKTISSYEYIRYYYGPYTRKILENLQDLADEGYIKIDTEINTNGNETLIYSILDKENINTTQLSEGEQDFIIEVLKDLAMYRARALTDIAYKTQPMTRLGATLGGNEHLKEKLEMTLG